MRKLKVVLTPSWLRPRVLWLEGSTLLRSSSARGAVCRSAVWLRAPPGPLQCPAWLRRHPQPDPHVGSRTSAGPPPADVSVAVPLKAPPRAQLRVLQPLPPTSDLIAACPGRPPDVHSRYGRALRVLRRRDGRVEQTASGSAGLRC